MTKEKLAQTIRDMCAEHGMAAIRPIVEEALNQAQNRALRECLHPTIQNRWSEGTERCPRCGWYVTPPRSSTGRASGL